MDSLVMPRNPLVSGANETEKPRLINPGFGDGYKQTSRDGLNAIAIVAAYSWRLTPAQADTALAFLRAHTGVTFLWTLPGETSARKWQTPDGWNRVRGTTTHTLTINFEERFDQA